MCEPITLPTHRFVNCFTPIGFANWGGLNQPRPARHSDWVSDDMLAAMTPAAPIICAHSSGSCRGDCAPVAATAYHLVPAAQRLYPIEISRLKQTGGEDGEFLESK